MQVADKTLGNVTMLSVSFEITGRQVKDYKSLLLTFLLLLSNNNLFISSTVNTLLL